MEMDNDITSITGSLYTAQFWEYDSRTMRRWNVDPIVKQWESPFATFSNNPILFNDPKGLDSYNVTDKGQFILLDEDPSQKNDILYSSTKNGNIDLSKSIDVEKGVLQNIRTINKIPIIYHGKLAIGFFDELKVSGDEQSDKLFIFLKDNTKVEWSNTKIGNNKNFITTSQANDYEIGMNWKITKSASPNEPLCEASHSHPGGGATASPADLQVAKDALQLYPNAKFNLFTPNNPKPTAFNGNETILEGTSIKPKVKGKSFIKPISITLKQKVDLTAIKK